LTIQIVAHDYQLLPGSLKQHIFTNFKAFGKFAQLNMNVVLTVTRHIKATTDYKRPNRGHHGQDRTNQKPIPNKPNTSSTNLPVTPFQIKGVFRWL
jgi:hypothetical protein